MTETRLLTYLRQFQKDQKSRVFAPLADQYRRMGKPEEGLRICMEGLKHHPRYAGGRVALGHCYMDLGRFDEAVKEYEFVLAHYPDNLQAIRGAASAYQALGESAKAIRYFRMYQFLVPKDDIVRDQLRRLEGQVKGFTEPPLAPVKKKGKEQLSFDGMSGMDHYLLSDFSGSPAPQRTRHSQFSRSEKIDKLYRLLSVIKTRQESLKQELKHDLYK